jgi:hypothetical protein
MLLFQLALQLKVILKSNQEAFLHSNIFSNVEPPENALLNNRFEDPRAVKDLTTPWLKI